MDYTVFDKVKAEFARRADEPEQAYMERLFRVACEGSDGEQRVNNLLAPRFCACDAAEHTLTLEYTAQPWMLNSKGTLHGGILSSTFDMTMGLLTRYYRGVNDVSTVTLTVHFLHPAFGGDVFRVRAKSDRAGRRVSFLSAEAADAPTGKLLGTATATFM